MARPDISEFVAPPDESPYPDGARAVVFTDGASRGNPGPAAYGCVYALDDGTVLCAEGVGIGEDTNNVAEWKGCIAALERLAAWGVADAVLRLDSELVVKQMRGVYKVKKEHLRPLYDRARTLSAKIPTLRIEHVRRADNALADAMANAALDGGTARADASH